MPDEVIGFNRQDADALLRQIGGSGGEVRQFTHPEDTASTTYPVIHAYTPSGGIPARSTLTMGSASCDVYESTTGGVLSDSGTNQTIYNMATSAVAGSTHIVAAKNDAGIYVVVVEDCG